MSEFHDGRGAGPDRTLDEQLTGRDLGGFDLGLHRRNEALVASVVGSKLPKAMKTGTTICGVIFANGVVLGADTRATEGTIISDKNCEKIHYIAPNIYCGGAGTAADTESITKLIASQLELLRRQTGTESRVVAAMTQLKRRLFQYQGQVSAALVLGGVDCTGPHLYTIYPHGSTDKLPYVTMGSGSLAAMAVLESGFADDLTEAAAIALVASAIRAGIFNDLGSGSNVDVTVIRAPGPDKPRGARADVTVLRNYETPNDVAPLRAKIARPPSRYIPRGATVVLSETFEPAAGRAAAAPAPRSAGAGESKMDVE